MASGATVLNGQPGQRRALRRGTTQPAIDARKAARRKRSTKRARPAESAEETARRHTGMGSRAVPEALARRRQAQTGPRQGHRVASDRRFFGPAHAIEHKRGTIRRHRAVRNKCRCRGEGRGGGQANGGGAQRRGSIPLLGGGHGSECRPPAPAVEQQGTGSSSC